MFTGIVVDTAAVERTGNGKGARVRLVPPEIPDNLREGASVACAGICLTVAARDADGFEADLSPETLARTTAGMWREDTRVNVEYALRAGDPIDGHLVTGHVDGTASVIAAGDGREGRRLRIATPASIASCIARKGSVAVDGVSLTVNEADAGSFGVALIPYTARNTTLGDLRPGDRVNLEADLLARYVARALGGRGAGGAA